MRGKLYNEALNKLRKDGHVMFEWGHTEEYRGKEIEITDSYVLDGYGNRYMATNFPEFCKYKKDGE